MDRAHRFLKPDVLALQITQLPDLVCLRHNLSRADTPAIQLTFNSNSMAVRPALTADLVEQADTKQLGKLTKAVNTEVTKVLVATTMATTSNAADGAATTEDIK
jgi:hypothetical protein